MKYLRFNVNGMALTKPKSTNLDNLISGSKGYLAAMFSFDHDWHGMRKCAVWVAGNRETPVAVEFNCAPMDDYTASKSEIGLYVVGQSKNGTRLQTNTLWFTQQTGGVANGKR